MTVPSADFTVSMPVPFRLYQAGRPGGAKLIGDELPRPHG